MKLDGYSHPYLDASENAFLRRELEHVRTKMYETLFPQFKGRSFISVNHEVPSGAEVDTYNVMKEYGRAKVGGGYSNVPPRVDISVSDVSAPIKPLFAAYGFSLQEVRAAMLGGRPLNQLKAKVARTVIEQEIDQIMLLGNAANGLSGLFLLSGTNTPTRTTGGGGDTWALKTSDEIVADFHKLVNESINVSKGIHKPDTIILPLTLHQLIKERRMLDSNNMSIKDHVLGTLDGIEIKESIFLESNTGWTGTRIMAYENKAELIESVIPQEYEQLAPQVQNYETVVNCHARIAGIRLPYPKTVSYMDNL